jgi:hypothetical protein
MAVIVAFGFMYLIAAGLCLSVVGATRAKCELAPSYRILGDGCDCLHGVELTVEHCQRVEEVPVYIEDAREVA